MASLVVSLAFYHAMWEEHYDFKQAADTVTPLKVDNGQAEYATALIQDLCELLTCIESQVNFLLKVVEDQHKAYPYSWKQTLEEQSAKD